MCSVVYADNLKPSDVKAPVISNNQTTWDCIYFGNYYQKNDSVKTPIKWRVLSRNGDNAFIMSDCALDVKQFNDVDESIPWEKSPLREWLNNDFYNTAFNNKEKSSIIKVRVNNNDSPYPKDPEMDTDDNIYLLSIMEACNSKYGFFKEFREPSDTRNCLATQYAISKGLWSMDDPAFGIVGSTWYWCRTIATHSAANMVIASGGCGYKEGYGVTVLWGVRPVLNIDLTKNTWTKADPVYAKVDENYVEKETTPKPNVLKVKTKKKTVKYKKLKKKKITIKKAIVASCGKLKIHYKKISGSEKFKINKKGYIIVQKKTKKGKYKIKVKVWAKDEGKIISKKVTARIVVK